MTTPTGSPSPRTQTTSEAQVLGKTETVGALYRLVDAANKFLVLVSPYTRIGKLRDLGRHLEQALARKVSVSLVIRRDATTQPWELADKQEVTRLMKAGLKLYEAPDLHAKIYLSENSALVTSLNLVEASFNNSIEVGVMLSRDSTAYAQLRNCLRTEIVKHAITSLEEEARQHAPVPEKSRKVNPERGRKSIGRTRNDREAARTSEDDACFRCGRTGHWAEDCYARTDVDGNELDDEDSPF